MTIQLRWNRQRGARVMARVVCAMTAVSVMGLASCKKEAPPPPPPPPPPPRVEEPKPLDAASVLQSMNVDARVEFAEAAAPVDRSLAEAAIRLADAIAQGDDAALGAMLDKIDHGALDKLIGDGRWYEATGKIEAVRVVSIDGGARLDKAPERAEVGLAVQDPDGAYIMLWAGRKVFDDWVFMARPTADEVRGRASAWDGMAPSAAGGAMGNAHLMAQTEEFSGLLNKAMSGPEALTMEELLRLKELVETTLGDEAHAEIRKLLDEEIAKRRERDGGDSGGGDDGGGGRRPGGG